MKSLVLFTALTALGLSQLDITAIRATIAGPMCAHYRQLEAVDAGEFNPPEAYAEVHKACNK